MSLMVFHDNCCFRREKDLLYLLSFHVVSRRLLDLLTFLGPHDWQSLDVEYLFLHFSVSIASLYDRDTVSSTFDSLSLKFDNVRHLSFTSFVVGHKETLRTTMR